jgi:hypothetical protein
MKSAESTVECSLKGASGFLQDWQGTQSKLGLDLEKTAYETKALVRKREVRAASDLLRLILVYCVCDWSLRLVGAWGVLQGVANLSDVALLKRFRNSHAWMGKLIGLLLQRRCQALRQVGSLRLRLVDASVVVEPGSQGTDWRMHLSLDLGQMCIDAIEVTDGHGGESLARFSAQPGEILVADRIYSVTSSLGPVLAQGSEVVVRANWHNLPLHTATGQRFDLIAWLQNLTDPAEQTLWVHTPQGQFEVRFIAQPLSPGAADKARRQARKTAAKKGHTLSPKTLLAAGFLLLVTNLPQATWSSQQVCWLYRMRWQIELHFKRLKSLLHVDHLRAKEPRLVQTYLLGKILAALVIDELAHQVCLQQPTWEAALDRPLSLWRLTAFLVEALRQLICGPFLLPHFFECLPLLRRYFCDTSRKRHQHLAFARAFLRLRS